MKKLTLSLDDLAVEGFATERGARDAGTVNGMESISGQRTCGDATICDPTSCYASCSC